MKTRRHSSITLLMVASVFLTLLALLTSCGVPTYIVPTVKFTQVSSADQTTSFTVSYSSDSSVAGSVDKIGLLLVYYLDDSSNANSEKSRIPSNFKSTYITATNDGRVVYLSDIDDPVVNYTYNNVEYNAYAFTLNGSVVEAPYYTYLSTAGLDNTADVTLNIELTYDNDEKSVKLQDDSTLFYLGFDSNFDPSENEYIRVFAAISVQSDNFSNLFWSPLTYVGAMQVPEAETTTTESE